MFWTCSAREFRRIRRRLLIFLTCLHWVKQYGTVRGVMQMPRWMENVKCKNVLCLPWRSCSSYACFRDRELRHVWNEWMDAVEWMLWKVCAIDCYSLCICLDGCKSLKTAALHLLSLLSLNDLLLLGPRAGWGFSGFVRKLKWNTCMIFFSARWAHQQNKSGKTIYCNLHNGSIYGSALTLYKYRAAHPLTYWRTERLAHSAKNGFTSLSSCRSK